jgi:hypothetical protein
VENRLDAATADVLRAFAESCWDRQGFSIMRPEDDPSGEMRYMDLFTTYMGIQILSLLDE